MSTDNVVFLEVIEWFDESGKELVHRIPESGSGEIKWGAQLTVRESQAGVFFYNGKAVAAFGPGRHTLKTANIPILTKILSMPWGMTSPLRAEVYMVNLKTFTDLKWGTRDPVAFRDSELGLIRLRAFGVFNVQVIQPVLFINTLVGTQGVFSTESIEGYLNRVIVSRFNDYMGQTIDTILNLPARYDEMSGKLIEKLLEDFSHLGLGLKQLYINAITPPPEVQQAIDDRGRMAAIQDMNKLMQMKVAMAFEKAASAETPVGQSMGTGLGLMMPAMFAPFLSSMQASSASVRAENSAMCPECQNSITADARFCPFCGHQQLVLIQCANYGKNLTPKDKFCPRCGRPANEKPGPLLCPACKTENWKGSIFCNQCGEKNG